MRRRTAAGDRSAELYRPETDIPFSPADAEALRDVLHYLGRALSAAPFAPVSASAEQTAEEAMAVLDGRAPRYLPMKAGCGWFASLGEPISPVQAAAEPKALRGVSARRGQGDFVRQERVVLRGLSVGTIRVSPSPARGVSGQRATALVLAPGESGTARLTEGAARLQLSAQQREVALMIALGQTNAEIAGKLVYRSIRRVTTSSRCSRNSTCMTARGGSGSTARVTGCFRAWPTRKR